MHKVIMDTLVAIGGLIDVEVPKRLLCFGVDSVNIFQGA
jgi:hypothetical protein